MANVGVHAALPIAGDDRDHWRQACEELEEQVADLESVQAAMTGVRLLVRKAALQLEEEMRGGLALEQALRSLLTRTWVYEASR
jgi:hypothetical protein